MQLAPLNPKLVAARLAILSVSIVPLAASSLIFPLNPKTVIYILLFAIAIFLTDLIVIEIPQEGTATASVAIILTAVLLGPEKMPSLVILLAAIIGTIASNSLRNKDLLSTFLVAAKRICAITIASFALWLWIYFTGSTDPFWSKLAGAIITALAYFSIDTGVDSLMFSLEKGVGYRVAFAGKAHLLAFVYLTFTTISLLMAIMFRWMDFWSVLVFSLPLAVTGQSFKLYLDIRKTYNSTIKALTATIEAQDTTREGHAQRVTDYSLAIARELGMYGNELERINYAAILHDIGKLGFDKTLKIQNITTATASSKAVPFHAMVGAEIISHVDYLKDISAIIKFHHYPNSKNNIDVPMEARIIHVADAFDHLIKTEKLNKREAMNKIKEDKGLDYDPKVVRAFSKILKRKY